MPSKTRPCPFCGGTSVTVKHSGRWGWFVSCSCAAVGPSASSHADAVRAWNTRVEPNQTSIYDLLDGADTVAAGGGRG